MSVFMSSYQGVLIATTLEEAQTILRLANKSMRYLYLWDLDWLHNPVWHNTAMNILRSDKLKIIARSVGHAEVIENFCNKEVCGYVDDWNRHQLLTVTGEE